VANLASGEALAEAVGRAAELEQMAAVGEPIEECRPEHRPKDAQLGPGQRDDGLVVRLALRPLAGIEAVRRRGLEAAEGS
jgi:hypothetical protein